MEKIEDLVIQKIKKENIKPVSKSAFVIKRVFVWLFLVLNIVFGAIAFSLTIYILTNDEDYQAIHQFNISFFERLIYTLPILWLILSFASIFLFDAVFKRTDKGYKFDIWKIFILNFVICAVLGLLLNLSGFSESINNSLTNNYPIYSKIFDRRSQLFMRPEDGLLIGKIYQVNPLKSEIQIIDPNGEKWTVKLGRKDFGSIYELERRRPIRIIGEIVDDKVFEADQIFQGRNQINQ